LQRLTLLIII